MSQKKSINNKVLTFVLLVGIVSTGFAGISAANSGQTLSEKTSGMQQGVKKMFSDGKHFGKRKWFWNLTDEEKAALDSMTDEEKKEFFQAKKAEKQAQKEEKKAVIDKLLAGESLSASEEALRGEMLIKIEEWAHKRNNADIIAKVLAGDALTEAEQIELVEMQEKHAERKAQKAIMEPIKAKLDAGEELTDEEQIVLDEVKAERKSHKRGGKHRGGHQDYDSE